MKTTTTTVKVIARAERFAYIVYDEAGTIARGMADTKEEAQKRGEDYAERLGC